MFGISRDTVSKVIIVFEKEKKTSQQTTSLAESRSCQTETVELYIELLEWTVKLRHLKLLLSLMNILRNNCPQKLSVKSCTKNILRKSCNSKAFRVVYGSSELLPWAVEKSDFPWRIVVFLIFENWPNVCFETAEKTFPSVCLQSTVKKRRRLCDDLGRHLLEIRSANDFLHGRIINRDYLQIISDQVNPM